MNLPFLNISYVWNHIYGLLCLASLSTFSGCCSLCQDFIPFCGCIIFHWMDGPHFVIYSSVGGPLGCPHFLTIVNSAAMNVCLQNLVWLYVFISPGTADIWSRIVLVVLCCRGLSWVCRMCSSILEPTHWMPVPHRHPTRCDNPECLQMLPNVP